MDESLICKAAILSGAIDKKGGIVNFVITKPTPSVSILLFCKLLQYSLRPSFEQYASCSSKAGMTLPWTWQVRSIMKIHKQILDTNYRFAVLNAHRNGNAQKASVEMNRMRCCKRQHAKML